jgi:hypothetical protein
MRTSAKPSRLAGLFGRFVARKEPPPASAPLRPFQAISIYRGLIACDTAKRFSEHRFLARDAPPLPLTGCTMSKTCQCRYIKHKDRRSEPRRLIDFGVATRLFDGKERRALNRRRSRD